MANDTNVAGFVKPGTLWANDRKSIILIGRDNTNMYLVLPDYDDEPYLTPGHVGRDGLVEYLEREGYEQIADIAVISAELLELRREEEVKNVS